MDKKSIAIIALTFMLIIVSSAFVLSIIQYNKRIKVESFREKFDFFKFNELKQFKLKNDGFYITPIAIVFDEMARSNPFIPNLRPSSPKLDVYVMNNFNESKNFSVELLPVTGNFSDPPYDLLRVDIYRHSNFELPPGGLSYVGLFFTPNVKEFTKNDVLRYSVKIFADGEVYGQKNVSVLAIRSKDFGREL